MSSSLPEWLQPLEYFCRPFPREAIESAIARRDEAIPHLLNALEWIEQNAQEAQDSKSRYMLHMYALFLLAQFRETRALPLVIRLCRHPEFVELTGDVVTQELGNILASVCAGDVEPIQALIEDPDVDQWVRSAAIRSLGVLIHGEGYSRDAVSNYFGTLFAGKLERTPNFTWDALASMCTDFGMSEHLPAIRAAYEEDLCDPFYDDLEDLAAEIMLPSGTSKRVDWSTYNLTDDTIAAMSWWHCFEEPSARDLDGLDEFGNYGPSMPVKRELPKIGRNALCPCLSGKKYKKCCGANA
jgi:hypothetical protein